MNIYNLQNKFTVKQRKQKEIIILTKNNKQIKQDYIVKYKLNVFKQIQSR